MSLSPGHLKARLTALEQYPTDVVEPETERTQRDEGVIQNIRRFLRRTIPIRIRERDDQLRAFFTKLLQTEIAIGQ